MKYLVNFDELGLAIFDGLILAILDGLYYIHMSGKMRLRDKSSEINMLMMAKTYILISSKYYILRLADVMKLGNTR